MKKLFMLVLAVVLCLGLCACKSSDYSKAMEQYAAGNYEQARDGFVALGDYESAAEMVKKCDYEIAMKLMKEENYADALTMFQALGDYESAAEMVKKCDYEIAVKLMKEENYVDALTMFQALGDYEDSMTHLLTCIQELGNIFMADYDFEAAVSLLTQYYEYPQVQMVYINLFIEYLGDNYVAPLTDAYNLWLEYLKVWMKEVEWATNNTPAGQYIDMPSVNTSHDLIVRALDKMQKANGAIAILRAGYTDANLEVCGPEVAEQIRIIFDCTDTVAGSFENLGGWAYSILLVGTPSPFASSSYTQAYAVQYAMDDIKEALTTLGELYK